MTNAEKLLARIASEKGRAIILLVVVDKDGKPALWVVQDALKVEGKIESDPD